MARQQTWIGRYSQALSLVLTALLFISGAIFQYCTLDLMEEQVDESRRATSLSHRPFLSFRVDYAHFALCIPKGVIESDPGTNVLAGVGQLPWSEVMDLGTDSLTVLYYLKGTAANIGQSPLLIRRHQQKGMTRAGWVQQCDKNFYTLLDTILARVDFDTLEIDLPIAAGDSSYRYNDTTTIGQRSISIEDVRRCLDSGKMVQYFYAYFEYESMWGELYNTLCVVHTIDSVWLDDKGHLLQVPKRAGVIERYRWDIQLSKVRHLHKEQGL